MNYTVVWNPDAENDLAFAWMRAVDKQALSAAANRLEKLLGDDPLNLGESRAGITRIAFDGPVGVICDVSEPDRRVTVLAVIVVE